MAKPSHAFSHLPDTPNAEERLKGDESICKLAVDAMWYYLSDKDDMQLVTSAVLFYASHRRYGTSDPVLRRNMILACKRSLQYGLDSLQLAKNLSLTFRNFDPEQELVRGYIRAVVVYLTNSHLLSWNLHQNCLIC